jgi:MFS transporter, OFA family, oxalate/formate antiporter
MNLINNLTLSRWKFVILGLLIMLMIGTVYSYSVFRVSIELVFNVNTAISGYPYMVALASYAIFMLITGKFIQQVHPKILLLGGGMLVALGWILSSFTYNILLFTITYGVLSGAGVGVMYGVPMAVVAKWFPDKKGLAVGCVIVGFGLSPLITAPLASQLIQLFGVMQAFLVLGVSFILLLPILVFPIRFPKLEEVVNYQPIGNINIISLDLDTKAMMSQNSFKGLYFNFILGTMIGLTLIGLTANIGTQYVGMEVVHVSQWMAIFAMFNGGGRPLFGWISDRLSIASAMMISFSLIASAALLMLFFGENNPLIFSMSFIIFWFNLGGWLAIAPTATMKLYGLKNYSQNYGVIFTAYGVGAILGVLTSGSILSVFNQIQLIFWYVLAVCVIGIVSTIFFFQKQ